MFQSFINMISKCLIYISLAAAVFFSGNIKDAYYRDYIGDAVVRVLNLEGTSGGTGFHIEAPSGKVYILTNNHVCELATDNKLMVEQNGEEMVREIVAKYEQHDLCLVEALPDYDRAIEIANTLDVGDDVVLIGHPGLRDLTLSSGEYIGKKEIKLPNFEIKRQRDCNGKWLENPMLIFIIGQPAVCMESVLTSALSAPSYGGNSGSPVVNKYGNLIGVLFAGNRAQVHDSFMVPLKNIKDFLRNY